jgi:6-phosphogluconolactonase
MTGKMVVCADPQDLAKRVADWLVERIAEKPGKLRIALSGGSTPKALFQLLATDEYSKRVPWQRVHLFWGDERFVPPDDHESNYGMTRATLLSKVPVPDTNIHPIPTDGTPEDAAARYGGGVGLRRSRTDGRRCASPSAIPSWKAAASSRSWSPVPGRRAS